MLLSVSLISLCVCFSPLSVLLSVSDFSVCLFLSSLSQRVCLSHSVVCLSVSPLFLNECACLCACLSLFLIEESCLSYPVILTVPTGSHSRGGDVAVYVFDINQPSLLTPFYSVLVSVSVFVALSTAFYSINSPDNSPLSHSVPPGLISAFLGLSTTYLFMKAFFSPDITPRG